MSDALKPSSLASSPGRCPVIPDGGVRGIATGAHDPSVGDDADTSPRAQRVGRRAEGRYEPIIVTTLRRYVRRGAPSSLLERLAGGRGGWRVLNQVYDLDGTAELLPPGTRSRELALDDDVVELTQVERRIAIAQIADECVDSGAAFPSPYRLGKYFGCDPRSILNDLRWMRVAEDPRADTSRADHLAAAGAP